MTYARELTNTPQSEPILGREDAMAKNDAGGYAFKLDQWKKLERFLILGAEGGTYYVSQHTLTVRNAQNLIQCLKDDGTRTVQTIVDVSQAGRAPRNNAALFALALAMTPAYADADTRAQARHALSKVARIGTHLFYFLDEVNQLRGWGRLLRSAVADWYTERNPESLAYQLVKYQQRGGWSHRDALRLSHPVTDSLAHIALFDYVTHDSISDALPRIVTGVELAKRAETADQIVGLIQEYSLTHEMIPNEFKREPEVWAAMLESMPMTAMIRNLGVMSANGLVTPMSDASSLIIDRLHDKDRIQKARVHPVTLLNALRTYDRGRGHRGSLTWNVDHNVSDALEDAFYLAFETIEPSNKRFMIALDVSSSMSWADLATMSLTAAEAAAAMALVTAKTEPKYVSMAFATRFREFPISKHDSIEAVTTRASRMNFGGTDCAQPMLYARDARMNIDTFVVYTDNETWAGRVQPVQALNQYRQASGINARLIVVGMTSSGFSIADPEDPGMLDVVGFDTSAPRVISEFASGAF